MIQIILPNFYFLQTINKKIIKIDKKYFKDFVDKINFIGVEGNFPFIYQDGSGLNNLNSFHFPSFADYTIVNNFLEYPKKICLDISNIKNDLSDLKNVQLNNILKLLDNGSNQLIISNLNFYKFLKDNFNYDLIFKNYYGLKYNQQEYKFKREKILYNDSIEIEDRKKIELALPLKCGTCKDYFKCKEKESLQQYLFSSNSICNQCSYANINLDQSTLINDLCQKGYRIFSFDITGISKNNIEIFIELYCKTFIKKEFYYEVLHYLTK